MEDDQWGLTSTLAFFFTLKKKYVLFILCVCMWVHIYVVHDR